MEALTEPLSGVASLSGQLSEKSRCELDEGYSPPAEDDSLAARFGAWGEGMCSLVGRWLSYNTADESACLASHNRGDARYASCATPQELTDAEILGRGAAELVGEQSSASRPRKPLGFARVVPCAQVLLFAVYVRPRDCSDVWRGAHARAPGKTGRG